MKIRIVGFQKTIGMPNFSNDKPIVVEADLEEGDSLQEAWSKMNKEAIEWHRKEYPNLYQEDANKPASIGVIQVDNTPADGDEALTLIRNAPSMEILGTFKLIASNNTELYKAYNQRLKELNNDKA